jgi:pimeloyl-ACP methyl ester carboxylesterase
VKRPAGSASINRRSLFQAVVGILLCAIGLRIARRESYEVHTVLATAGGCNMPTDMYEPRAGTPVGSVILFHGLSANKKVMSFTAQEFANQDLRVFVPDLPGHGKAPGPFSPLRVESCAEALVRDLATRQAIVPERTLLAGHSMGAAVATRVAAHFPVAGVIAISPAPMHPGPGLDPELLLFPEPPVLAAHSLVLSASWEPASIRQIAKELVAESVNSSNRYDTVPNTTHVSILFARDTFESIRSWTSQILGTNPTAPFPKNMPALGCILGLIGLSILAPSFLREMTAASSNNLALDSNPPFSLMRISLLLTLFSGFSTALLRFFVPFQFLHIFQGGYMVSFLFIVGVAMLIVYRQFVPSPKCFFNSSIAAASVAAILLVFLFGSWLELTFYEAWLTPARWLRFPLLVLVLVPWHLAEELVLGDPGSTPRFRRLCRFFAFRTIPWLILVAAIFYLRSGQFVFILLVFYFFLFSLLQRLANDVIRAQTRSISAAAIFSAILLAAFALAILPLA